MKLSMIVLALFAVIGMVDNAHASRARNLVMGSGTGSSIAIDRGSLFYDDQQNIFYNPSYVNDFKNWATIEASNGAGSSEGGFVYNFMNFNLGAYMNRGGAVNGGYTTAPVSTTPVRPIDLFIGSEMGGLKWGVSGTLASKRLSDDVSSNDVTLKAGVQIMNFEPYANFKIIGKESITSGGTTTEGKNKDMGVGLRYKGLGAWTPYIALRKTTSVDLDIAGAGVNGGETKTSAFGFGIGHNMKVADTGRVNYAVSYWASNTGGNDPQAMLAAATRRQIPIDINGEADVASWIAVRAGISYALMDQTSKVTNAGTTRGSLGASFKFSKVNFDWAVGHAAGAETISGPTFDLANGFFTAASLTYNM